MKNLVLIPVKGISSLPIALLEPLGDGRKTAELFAVSFLPLISDVRHEPEFIVRNFTSPLMIANPTSDLPGTEKEVDIAYKRFPNATLLRREQATSSRTIEQLRHGNHDLIYFAAHGRSTLYDAVRNSGIELSDRLMTTEDLLLNVNIFRDHPLVILSACQTGEGEAHEAGVISLALAFQKASASNTVMSLWLINDFGTATFMEQFLEALQRHHAPEALRIAVVEARRRNLPPSVWAAFNVFGHHGVDYRSIR